MAEKQVKKILQVDGMTCSSCEIRIENHLENLDGIVDVKAFFATSHIYVTYDENRLALSKIIKLIEELDYKVKGELVNNRKVIKQETAGSAADDNDWGQLTGIGIIVLAVYTVFKNTIGFNYIPLADQSMSYGILVVIGLLTSLHCIAMCGGINLTVSMQGGDSGGGSRFARLMPGAMYNIGRVLSYTVLGGLAGSLGSVISFSSAAKGAVTIFTGIFMVVMGLNMLNVFPWFRRFNLSMPKVFGRSIHGKAGHKGPLVVGILNGLMPCGPLQAMQLYALGTGSFAAGAISMFLFSASTVPLVFGLGSVGSFLKGRSAHKLMRISAVLVVLLGVIMLNRGLNLSGYNATLAFGGSGGTGSIARMEGGVQIVTTRLKSGRYQPIVVQKGLPVKWNIIAADEDLNGCNDAITAREFSIEDRKLGVGDNFIEFTPDRVGNFIYTCWMGMIRSNIKVVTDITKVSGQDIEQLNDTSNQGGTLDGS